MAAFFLHSHKVQRGLTSNKARLKFKVIAGGYMDLNTIASVALGGLIALIPVLITNWHQTREREKDRKEARRVSELQIKGKLIERDVFAVMDTCDDLAISLRRTRGATDDLRAVVQKFNSGKITKEQKEIEEEIINKKLDENIKTVFERQAIGLGRLYYLGKEIIDAYYAYESVFDQLFKVYTGEKEREADNIKLWPELYARRGDLQKLLTEKILENSAAIRELEY
jgi:hypothetical protein